MRVAVAGVDSVVGRCAVPALEAAGHDVVDVAGSRPLLESLHDGEGLVALVSDCDAVVNLSARIPFGPVARSARAWRRHDLHRSFGARRLTEAARRGGVRRVVQQSVSFVYADQGPAWVTERSPLCVTAATESASVGELVVQKFAAPCRAGVVLRMGLVLGDSSLSRWSLRAAADGRPVGVGDPAGFAHVIHSDDVGPALLAALDAPSGTYNVGAEPVRRDTLAQGCAEAAGRHRAEFFSPWRLRLAGHRFEPLARSLRVSSALFGAASGWAPRRSVFEPSWFEASGALQDAHR